MRIKKPKKLKYIPLEELKKINREYLDELEAEKARLETLGDKKLIDSFQENLLSTYESRINLLAEECAVDYVIKKTEIRERAREFTPWRRCWLWRLLLFVPITNRAQDVIEERAALDADKLHSAQETENAQGWKELEARYYTDEPNLSDSNKKLSKRKLKRLIKATEKEADNADVREVLNEPEHNELIPETTDKLQADTAAPVIPEINGLPPRRARQPVRKRDQKPVTSERAPGELPGQVHIADVVNADKPVQ